MLSTARSTETVIEAKDLSVGYEGIPVLTGINFTVASGEVFVIGGGSGCGKSTLMKAMITLLPPIDGTLRIAGHELVTGGEAVVESVRHSIGVMYQGGALFGGLTVLENVRLAMEENGLYTMNEMNSLALSLLAMVDLDEHCNKMPSALSGGMQKRAAVARALAMNPKIVFLDEPSAGLDPISSAEFDQMVVRLARSTGRTFVVVTHELPSIFTIADRMVVLGGENKTQLAIGTPKELLESGPTDVRRFLARQPEDQTLQGAAS
ncbi:MAG: ATP-binding cassette domain-containing protein [Planctomycetes bacterium]|nr:ATP-binding cassette domain-containing protein [Planctomycetota bacterium]